MASAGLSARDAAEATINQRADHRPSQGDPVRCTPNTRDRPRPLAAALVCCGKPAMSSNAGRGAPSATAGDMTGTVDIKAFIDGQPISAFQWCLVATCFLVVAADGMDVAIMGFVNPPILQEWDISRPAFGIVISAAPFGLVIGTLVAGPSSDRFGRKVVLITSILVFGALTLAAANASSPTEMALLRLLAGMGMGAAMPNATTLLSEYALQRRRSLMITVMFTGFNLGSAAIGFAAGYLIPLHGLQGHSVLITGFQERAADRS